MIVAEPKSLIEDLQAILRQLQYTISPTSLGSESLLQSVAIPRGGTSFQHLFTSTARPSKSRRSDDQQGKPQASTPRKSSNPLIARAPNCSLPFLEIIPKIIPAPYINKRNVCVKFHAIDFEGCTPSNGRQRCGLGHISIRDIDSLSFTELEPFRAWFQKHEEFIAPTKAALSSKIFKE